MHTKLVVHRYENAIMCPIVSSMERIYHNFDFGKGHLHEGLSSCNASGNIYYTNTTKMG